MILTKEWIGGFVNGEGCFTFGGANKISPYFTISLRITDLTILEMLKEIIGVGSICIHKKQNSCTYQVCSLSVNKIIKFFENQFIGDKLIDFENWKKGVKLWEQQNHKYSDELFELIKTLKPKYRHL